MYPELVILVKTWQGPPGVLSNRLASAKRMFASIAEFLCYPNYTWHVADDGSKREYQQTFLALLGNRSYTFTDSRANGDIGRSLNMGMRAVLERTDYVLHWSDDIVLEREMDLVPYVELLHDHEDIGVVRLRPTNAKLWTRAIERNEHTWQVISSTSPNRFLIVTSLNLMHRRTWDFYGPYPEGLRIDYMQEEMSWRYRRFAGGPKIVIPDTIMYHTEPLCIGRSTWEWRMKSEEEKAAWYRYRSYSARFGHD